MGVLNNASENAGPQTAQFDPLKLSEGRLISKDPSTSNEKEESNSQKEYKDHAKQKESKGDQLGRERSKTAKNLSNLK